MIRRHRAPYNRAMPAPALSANRRRLRWALLIALGLHALLGWRYAPQLFDRFETIRRDGATQSEEVALDIAPLPPPPKGRGFALATQLAAGSPEQLQPALPKDFFAKPAPLAGGRLQLSDDLTLARQRTAALVANIVPAAARLASINAISDHPRAPPVKESSPSSSQQVPYLLAPATTDADVDVALLEAARAAERNVRAANSAVTKPAPDYRALLPQGPLVTETQRAQPSSMTGYTLDAPTLPGSVRSAPDEGKDAPAARQQFFSQLTAQLKVANQRALAQAVKVGPRVMVRMRFLLNRQGQVIEISPAESMDASLAQRAAAVVRAATLPPVPAEMTQVPVELSFPIEVYR